MWYQLHDLTLSDRPPRARTSGRGLQSNNRAQREVTGRRVTRSRFLVLDKHNPLPTPHAFGNDNYSPSPRGLVVAGGTRRIHRDANFPASENETVANPVLCRPPGQSPICANRRTAPVHPESQKLYTLPKIPCARFHRKAARKESGAIGDSGAAALLRVNPSKVIQAAFIQILIASSRASNHAIGRSLPRHAVVSFGNAGDVRPVLGSDRRFVVNYLRSANCASKRN